VSDTIPGRVADYLKANDRLLDGTLAPAALLSPRFNVLRDDDSAVEIDKLCALFYRLPRLPRLASSDVLRQCLAAGVEGGVFGLASGAAWDAPDAVLRYGARVDSGEIQFQPGTWLVRAAVIEPMVQDRKGPPPHVDGGGGVEGGEPAHVPTATQGGSFEPPVAGPGEITRVRLVVRGAPTDKVRDIIKVAVFPLATHGAEVSTTIEIVALNSGGFSRNELDLVVREGLNQLGVAFEIEER
jgi:hypothetical protein